MPMRSRARTRRLARFGPECDRKHSAQPGKTGGIPLEESVQNRFRISAGVESVPTLFQFDAQFRVIVDFAIENDDRVAVI